MSPSLCGIVSTIVDLIRASIPLLASFAVLFFMFTTFQYVFHTTEGKRNDDKEKIFWGLVALFVLFSLWGILGVLKTAFFPDSGGGNAAACGSVSAKNAPTSTLQLNSKAGAPSLQGAPSLNVAPAYPVAR